MSVLIALAVSIGLLAVVATWLFFGLLAAFICKSGRRLLPGQAITTTGAKATDSRILLSA